MSNFRNGLCGLSLHVGLLSLSAVCSEALSCFLYPSPTSTFPKPPPDPRLGPRPPPNLASGTEGNISCLQGGWAGSGPSGMILLGRRGGSSSFLTICSLCQSLLGWKGRWSVQNTVHLSSRCLTDKPAFQVCAEESWLGEVLSMRTLHFSPEDSNTRLRPFQLECPWVLGNILDYINSPHFFFKIIEEMHVYCRNWKVWIMQKNDNELNSVILL